MTMLMMEKAIMMAIMMAIMAHRSSGRIVNSITLALHSPQWPRAISPSSWVRDHRASC